MFDKPYNHQEVEEKIYDLWEKSGFFNPDNLSPTAVDITQTAADDKTRKIPRLSASSLRKPVSGPRKSAFTIIMPPPNANGSLHLGHALAIGIEDIMVRYHRMKGDRTLWLPGADHAGFETQVVYEKRLEKEGRSRLHIPAKQLWQEIWDFTQANKKTMEGQVRRLGASCDWSREKFTLDADIVSKTQDTFIQMHKNGLIYRGNRLVHWCPKHQTGFSDLELIHEERLDALYYIKYGPLVVATVRPETIFGDVAVAVNPKDKKYKDFIDKEIEVDVVVAKLKLKVIADAAVDPNFGTGAVKITPAHDSNDYEMWQRHKKEINFEPKEVINQFAKMHLVQYFSSAEAKKYEGLKVLEARKLIVEDLEKKKLIEKVDSTYRHNVAMCYKCKNLIEPRLMAQWFIKMEPLAKPAIRTVKNGRIKIIPDRFKKVYFHWMKNIRDWNISRQIVWGIKIPAWRYQDCLEDKNEWIISKEKPQNCPKCKNKNLEQDRDIFDTWFSSGQWPFLTLGYPKEKDYKNFYPTTVMETGWDILFFWVARMIILGIYRNQKNPSKEIPFKYVYLHGLVRDEFKQKMSKSKGNVIDPLGVVNEYGADALRMALIIGNTPGNDLAFSEDKVRGYRNFANKIWQASRFVLMNTNSLSSPRFLSFPPRRRASSLRGRLQRESSVLLSSRKWESRKLSTNDKKYLKEFETVKKKVTKQIEEFKFHMAAEEIYHYFWHTFCDKIIEEMKPRLQTKKDNGEKNDKAAAQYVLLEILSGSLKLLHPFMPFITEEIYQHLPNKETEFLMIENW